MINFQLLGFPFPFAILYIGGRGLSAFFVIPCLILIMFSLSYWTYLFGLHYEDYEPSGWKLMPLFISYGKAIIGFFTALVAILLVILNPELFLYGKYFALVHLLAYCVGVTLTFGFISKMIQRDGWVANLIIACAASIANRFRRISSNT